MEESKIIQYAMELREAHGEQAQAEAARKAEAFRTGGDLEQAKVWEGILDALYEMQGPHSS